MGFQLMVIGHVLPQVAKNALFMELIYQVGFKHKRAWSMDPSSAAPLPACEQWARGAMGYHTGEYNGTNCH